MQSEQKRINKAYVYCVSTIAAVGTFLFGYDFTLVEGGILFVKRQFSLTPSQMGFAASSLFLGTIGGALLFLLLADRLGRKRVLCVAATFYALSAVGTAVAGNVVEFDIFRIVSGLALALAAAGVPLYIVEIAPAAIRGTLGTLSTFAIVIGAASAITVCYYLSFRENWRWMFGSATFPAIIFLIGLSFIPESPRWLAQKGRNDGAYKILESISGQDPARHEMDAIQASLGQETGTWSELYRPGIRSATIVALGLAFFQQATGPGPTIVYAAVIFQNAGFAKTTDAIFQALLLNLWQVLLTVPAVLYVDRAGRKPLLLIGSAGISISELLLGVALYSHANPELVLLMFLLALGFFAFSLAPVGWLMLSEIFPLRNRAKGMAVATISGWTWMFILAQLLPEWMVHSQKTYGSPAVVFWLFGFLSILSFLFCWFVVPETKGRPLEEIAKHLVGQKGFMKAPTRRGRL